VAANGDGRDNRGRWRRGASGNPAGRPHKGSTVTDILETLGDTRTEKGITRKEALGERLWEMALNGEMAAIRLIIEYLDGKPLQQMVAEVSQAMAPFTATEAAEAEQDLSLWEDALADAEREERDEEDGEPDEDGDGTATA
jgi:ribosomal protein L12E/L44/L45/RPP1/RPP2